MFRKSGGNPYAHNHVISSFGHRLEYRRPGSTTGHPARLNPLSIDTLPSWIRNVELDLQLCQIPRFWWIETAMLYLPKSIRAKMNKRRQAFQEEDHSDWSWHQFQENLQTVLRLAAPSPPLSQPVGAVPAAAGNSIFHPLSFMPGARNFVRH